MGHNLNPFDFVPFTKDKPIVKTIDNWFGKEKLLTGYLELQIKALSPIHIVGSQEVSNNGQKIVKSQFFRRFGKAYIPGPTIRGMLRSFIEAACNCWASQLTPYYLKEPDKRQVGFQVIDSQEQLEKKHEWHKIDSSLALSLSEDFIMPQKLTDEQISNFKVDLASFLFGYIPAEGKGFKGRIMIQDAEINDSDLILNDHYIVPDIDADAFMGGGKPSASSWWYQKPDQIRLKSTKYGPGVEFIGVGYRGRKFYYHQNPESCVDWYRNPENWPLDQTRPLYFLPLECFIPQHETKPFKIFYEDLPESMLKLLLLSLKPGKRIHHKLGYGKPYGYGSIECINIGGKIRNKSNESLSVAQQLATIQTALWNKENLNSLHLGQFLHFPSIEALLKILWYSDNSNLTFTYPVFNPGYKVTNNTLQNLKKNHLDDSILPSLEKLKKNDACTEKDFFNNLLRISRLNLSKEQKNLIKTNALYVPGGFLPTITYNALKRVLDYTQNNDLRNDNKLYLNDSEAKYIAEELANLGLRPALHFDVYKEKSDAYEHIQKRKMNIAETPAGDNI